MRLAPSGHCWARSPRAWFSTGRRCGSGALAGVGARPGLALGGCARGTSAGLWPGRSVRPDPVARPRAVLRSANLAVATDPAGVTGDRQTAEEAGWRGWLLPWLLPRFSPLAAASLVSVVWALWHVPMSSCTELSRRRGGVRAGVRRQPVVRVGGIDLAQGAVRGIDAARDLWHGSYDLLAGRRGFGGLGRVGGERADRIPLESVWPSRSCACGAAAGPCSPRWTVRQSAGGSGNRTAISQAADPRAAAGCSGRQILEKNC